VRMITKNPVELWMVKREEGKTYEGRKTVVCDDRRRVEKREEENKENPSEALP